MIYTKFEVRIKRAALSAALFFMSGIAVAQVGFGDAKKFNDGWLFELSDVKGAENPLMADSTWRRLNLPHDWSIEGTCSPDLASCTGYLPGGIGWYRKHFDYDAAKETGKKKYIYFEGVYNRSDVYLNGHLLGNRPNGYASFMYDLTPDLQDGDNVIAARADQSRYADSRYYTGSGIYRDVWMVDAPDTHIAQWGVGFETTKVKGGKADVKVTVDVDNPVKGLKVKASLIDADGKQVASTVRQALDDNVLNLSVPRARLWSIDSPELYTLRTEL